MKTEILLDHERTGVGRTVRVLLRVSTAARASAERLPLNLSLVLDRSGSMHGEKLAAARSAAARLVRRLAPDDIVSVVAYDDDVTTVAEPATGAAQMALPRQIERIRSGGCTNLSGGWLRARELVSAHQLDHGVNRIILLTDGLANVGILEPKKLVGLAAQGRRAGITTTTIGFGADYDEHLLRDMADSGGGSTYYIEHADQATAIFGDELQDLMDMGAQNVSVTVRPAAAARVVAVHHDYPSAASGTLLRLELGDVYAREPKPVLIELLVDDDVHGSDNEAASATHGAAPGDDAAVDVPVVELVVSGDVLTDDGGVERQVVTLPVILSREEGARVDPEVRKEMLLLAAARARGEALELRRRGDPGAAADVLRRTGEMLRDAGLADMRLDEDAAELAAMSQAFAAGHVSAADQKYLHIRAHNAKRGRRLKDELIRREVGEDE